MVDFGRSTPPLSVEELLMDRLRPGDIYTHAYAHVEHREPIVDHQGQCLWIFFGVQLPTVLRLLEELLKLADKGRDVFSYCSTHLFIVGSQFDRSIDRKTAFVLLVRTAFFDHSQINHPRRCFRCTRFFSICGSTAKE